MQVYTNIPSSPLLLWWPLRHLCGLVWNWDSPRSDRQSVPIMRWSFKEVALQRDEETGCFRAPRCSAHLAKSLWEKLMQREFSCFDLRVRRPTASCLWAEGRRAHLGYFLTLHWYGTRHTLWTLGRKHNNYTSLWVMKSWLERHLASAPLPQDRQEGTGWGQLPGRSQHPADLPLYISA